MRPYLLLTRRSFHILLTLWALVLAGEASAQEIEICYNFSCKTRQTVTLSQTEWHSIIGWFYPGATSAAGEREQLRRAIGWMEVVVGRHTPTHRDKGLNLEKNPNFPGQLDCIDESLNITTYMHLFESQGHLHWHHVMDRAYRSGGFDSHWAGQLQEVATGERFVIDSWFQDNGMLPYIARSAKWEDLTEARILLFSGAD
jgi:hypothetical protein